jgi:hypothetical protein
MEVFPQPIGLDNNATSIRDSYQAIGKKNSKDPVYINSLLLHQLCFVLFNLLIFHFLLLKYHLLLLFYSTKHSVNYLDYFLNTILS